MLSFGIPMHCMYIMYLHCRENIQKIKINKLESGEVTWQLGAFFALVEDPGSVLSTPMVAHSHRKLQV